MSNIDKELESKFLKSSQLRLKSSKDGILRTGPEFVRIGLSRSCNFNCITCWHYSPFLKRQKPIEWKKIKIEKDLVFSLLRQLGQMKCLGVLFSGVGEPFTHPNTMGFIRKAKENKMLVRIQTNLSLVENPAELANYLRSAADLVCIHLSAATPETYSRMHPNQPKKKFHQILDRIRVLRREGVPVRLVFVVNKLNYKEITKMYKLNCDLGTKLHLEVMDHRPGSGLEKLNLDENDKKEIIQDLCQLRNVRDRKAKSGIKDFLDQIIYPGLGLKEISSCSIGYFYSIIDETGNVYYCYNMNENFLIGNLKNQSFKEVWLSNKYQELRARYLKGRFSKDCQRCMKERGSNFKVRLYIQPELRNFDMERKLMFCKMSSVNI
jgi:radical SAM protein with 4Fe4S-binding SPASM domain